MKVRFLRAWRAGAIWLALVVAVATPAASAAVADTEVTHRLHGKAVRVVDGDTIRLQADDRRYYTIRLASIDAPEIGRESARPGQPYSQAARRTLDDMVRGKRLNAECYEVDSYGRDICDVLLPDGRSANRELVRAGMAWANAEKQGRFLRDETMSDLQREAREQRRGLWSRRDPVAPWQWRYQCWRQQQCPQAAGHS